MTVLRMDHVGVVVDDLAAAIAFFEALGLELVGEWTGEGDLVERVTGLDDVRAEVAMVQTPDGNGRLELMTFTSPPNEGGDAAAPANTRGLRHLTFAVDDVEATLTALEAHGGELIGEVAQYEQSYRLCYVRGPAGVIVEVAQPLS